MLDSARLSIALFCLLCLSACESAEHTGPSAKDIISQKLILDIRYFCESQMKEGRNCREAVTELSPSLQKLIQKYPLGGIILFAENFASIEQSVQLGHDLQKASLASRHNTPLLITTDQEGGAVTRLPANWSTSFAGNMAIAATPPDERREMAYLVGHATGAELHALGVNVNHAPVLDVNSNPANPVIHVRAFSDTSEVVANLGVAMARGLADAGVAPNAKHFPGHGDTATDSHIGLAAVNRPREAVFQHELAPFAHLIHEGLLPLVMTAHIQFPSLDDSMLTSKTGEKVVVPATLSRKIITDLLRGELNFKGVVVSDAINMKAVSTLLSPEQATLKAFEAGVDLVLMPVTIRSPKDIDKLDQFITELAAHVPEQHEEWSQSVTRINKLKTALQIREWAATPLDLKVQKAKKVIGSEEHQKLAEHLAKQSLSLASGHENFEPINIKQHKNIRIIVPKPEQAIALKDALTSRIGADGIDIKAYSLPEILGSNPEKLLEGADLLIIGNSSPKTTLAEIGGMEDWGKLVASGPETQSVSTYLQHYIKLAHKSDVTSIFVSFGFPYELANHLNSADIRIAAYNDKVTALDNGKYTSATIEALADALTGKTDMPGTIPIDLSKRSKRP